MTIVEKLEKLESHNSSVSRFEKVRLQFVSSVESFSNVLSSIEIVDKLPEVIIYDKTVVISYVNGQDYFDYELGITIDGLTLNFCKYKNTNRHLVTGEEGKYIEESHELYLSASEIVRTYQDEVSIE